MIKVGLAKNAGALAVSGVVLLTIQCTLGYSDFHNLMGFTSKMLSNNILKNGC